ncbi:glycosyl transferase [Lentzea sp. NBRC 105346]|nr:glycosyl transferase [Lentzea sp. NBRC 105346]
MFGSLPEMSHEEANRTVVAEIFARLDAAAAVPRLLEAIASWRPDLVIRESAEYGSLVAAEVHGVPCIRVNSGLTVVEDQMLSMASSNVDLLRLSYGLPAGLPETPYYTLFPSSLEETPSSAVRFRDPAWVRSTATSPFVYATFGSVAGGLPHVAEAFDKALAALGSVDAPALLTTGGADVSSAPPNVRVSTWVDQTAVLSRATAVVCHGGGGSTLGALAAGVPLVVVPLFAEDQYVNARRVAALGAGLSVGPSDIGPALREVMADPSFATAARAVAAGIATHPSTDTAFT